MFEYAISQQRKRPPSRRFIAALVVSVVCHLVTLEVLLEYPWLLGRGLKNWLRQPVFFSAAATKEPSWRTVTFVGKNGKMEMPSGETLKKFTYDWAAHKPGAAPPIRIRWSGDTPEAKAETREPGPAPKPVPGFQEPRAPVETGAGKSAAANPVQGGGENPPAGGDAAAGRVAVYLPPPQPAVEPKQLPKKLPEAAANVAPSSIPADKPGAAGADTSIAKAAGNSQAKPAPPQVFENEQKAIKSEGTGFFDTKGFPLGDYASLIIERVKGNWSIPSNLRNSQGRTTVIFFIDKDGRFTDARIVISSGSNSLDLAALNAVIGSNPFPPLPKGFPGNQVGAKFVFSYNERQ